MHGHYRPPVALWDAPPAQTEEFAPQPSPRGQLVCNGPSGPARNHAAPLPRFSRLARLMPARRAISDCAVEIRSQRHPHGPWPAYLVSLGLYEYSYEMGPLFSGAFLIRQRLMCLYYGDECRTPAGQRLFEMARWAG